MLHGGDVILCAVEYSDGDCGCGDGEANRYTTLWHVLQAHSYAVNNYSVDFNILERP